MEKIYKFDIKLANLLKTDYDKASENKCTVILYSNLQN